ncbi:MAG TPA: hypothetical protein VLI05_04885 [Candidatus Saccharimonadia bacterium]|nr:hypothetical protein [Candidatus Saccharimonadia bacterium]
MQIIRCVLSGSYRRDFATLERDYRELVAAGCQILSPHRLTFLDRSAEFVKDVAETPLDPHEIERHHLLALRQSDLVWLHCPDGYVGVSAAMEVGYALALNVPIFSKLLPQDPVFSQLVTVVPSVFMALESLRNNQLVSE